MFKLFRRPEVAERVRTEPPGQYNASQQRDRDADELVGLCRGMLADGAVTRQEASFLQDWIDRHAQHAHAYPFNLLYRQLHNALADGVLDLEEERDLLATLMALVGGEARGGPQASASLSSVLPLCDPPPAITFSGAVFVVTGTFAFGPRRSVVDAIESRGGQANPNVSKKVNYLVIGEIGSQAWRHSSYGRKIEAAVELREAGAPMRIVSEAHWSRALSS